MGVQPQAATPSASETFQIKFVTTVVDYALAFGLLALMGHLVSGENFIPGRVVLFYPIVPLVTSFRDDVMGRVIWRKFTSPAKLAWSHSWDHSFIALKTISFVMVAIYGQVWLGMFDFPPLVSWHDWARIWVEFLVITLLKDLTAMNYLHDWMHKHAYDLHKRHHHAHADVQVWHAWEFDLVDVTLENTGGPLLALGLKMLFGMGSSLHLCSFLLSIIADMGLHSMNPYTVYFFNPVLDYFGRAVICHNLHHAANKGYMMVVPFHHFYNPASRQTDMDKYNKYMKTAWPL